MNKYQKNSLLQIMVLGTGSDVGKSIIAAGLCRVLWRRGYRVSPFKAQNMALNSFVTMDGKEMGRAQVMQAYAAGILPQSDMNPVLLKPSGDGTSQVIVQGDVYTVAQAGSYYNMKQTLFPRIIESFNRLKKNYDAVVLEGAGSTAEVNLKDRDMVNINMALAVNCPCLLVADIERGGVFASIIGTMKLLSRKEKKLIIGIIINKFRGDKKLLDSGVAFLERKTRKKVMGVIPYFRDIHLPEEDSVALNSGKKGGLSRSSKVKIGIIHLPYISNYTDFDPLELEEEVSVVYIRDPGEIRDCQVMIIPGTKNTIHDLLWMKNKGFRTALAEHASKKKTLLGICGGYQMLGRIIEDPWGVESGFSREEGLGFLNLETTLHRKKTLTRVNAVCNLKTIADGSEGNPEVEGYEIHMGVSRAGKGYRPAFTITETAGKSLHKHDGSAAESGKIWGTYLHGLFENDQFRRLFLKAEGVPASNINYRQFLEAQFNRLGDFIEENVDVQGIIKSCRAFC
ncbi:MAG: cobyric acid synthase [Spirochaetota bacterium]